MLACRLIAIFYLLIITPIFYFGLPQSGKRHRSIFQEEEKNQKVCSQRVITDWRNPKFLNKSFQVFDAASLTLDFEAYTIKLFTIVIYH